MVARACARRGVRLVHFSTNYVFSGTLDRPYTEDDPPDPVGTDARSKRGGEEAALAEAPDALVIRSSALFGHAGSAVKGGSFASRILARAVAREPLTVVADQWVNPTFTRDLAEGALGLVEAGSAGVVHLVAEGCCTWHEFAIATLDAAGIAAEVAPTTTEELNAPADRPRNGCLASVRVSPLRHWRTGLAAFVRELGSP